MPDSTLIIACGALAREIGAIIDGNGLGHISLRCLPADLHNRPERIPAAVRTEIRKAKAEGYMRVLVGYGDCGTGGRLDKVCADEGVSRLPGPHCYAFYTGVQAFMENPEADMRSFFLTDFLARHFESFVIEPLGLDRHPELRDQYFGHYERVVYLQQNTGEDLEDRARTAAQRLGLEFEKRFTGYGDLADFVAGTPVQVGQPEGVE